MASEASHEPWANTRASNTDITLLIIELELIKSNRESARKATGAYLIERGKTLKPLGINKKDEKYY